MRTIRTLAPAMALIVLAACSKPAPKEYGYPALGFAATFPAPPKLTDTPASADGSSPHTVVVEASADGYDFAVNVIDASQATESTDEMLDAAPKAVAQAAELDVGPTTNTAVGRYAGREVRFDKNGKPAMLMRFYFVGDRFYEVSGNSPKGPTDPAVRAFLNSFHVLNGGESAAQPPAPAANSAAATNAAPAGSNVPQP
jgi:hypothetical protein